MTEPVSEIHPHWGQNITEYPGLYSSKAIAANVKIPVNDTKRAEWQGIAMSTIKDICMLCDSNIKPHSYNNLVARITLDKIEATLETACFLGELESFTLPSLIAGCIELMLTVKPSPFYYEYGYVCFRLMNVVLSICLIKHTCDSNQSVSIARKNNPNDSVSALWGIAATIVKAELSGNTERFWGIARFEPPKYWEMPLLDKPILNRILAMLYLDRKNFTTALTRAKSLGLSGLLYVLHKFIEDKKAEMNETRYQEQIFKPYVCILYRCLLGMRDDLSKLQFMTLISKSGSPNVFIVAMTCDQPVDLEDLRNIIEAYNSLLEHQEFLEIIDCGDLMGFVQPFDIQGCEDLVPNMFSASIEVLWRSLSSPNPRTYAAMMVYCILMTSFFNILERLQPSQADNSSQTWVSRLTESIITSDVVSLVLRATLVQPALESSELESKGRPMQNFVARAMEMFVSLMELIPKHYLINCLRNSGALYDMKKYLVHFGSCDFYDQEGYTLTIRPAELAYNDILIRFHEVLLGHGWQGELSFARTSGICDNPRCPFPFGAEFAGSEGKDTAFCSTRCQAL